MSATVSLIGGVVAAFSAARDKPGPDCPGSGVAYCLGWVGREATICHDVLADGFLGSPRIDGCM